MNEEKRSKLFVGIILSIIVFAAFAVRFYNFHDWQYFKMDQGRDAQLIGHAIKDGPSALPLLGPRAGATAVDNGFLRLGPAYYYFQYLSGVIFDSTDPEVFAYPDLFFSILAIILLYFFVRLYFVQHISLLITAMYAFSFIIIEYSRFAWNPNPLQFFVILVFLALIKSLNAENNRAKLGWLALWALALAIGSQLHFFGFFVLVGVSGLFILIRSEFWKKERRTALLSLDFLKKFAIRALVFVAVFSFIYTPVIISDVMKKGENAQNFVQALSSKPSDKPFFNKVGNNFIENTKYYCLITTSFCNVGKLEDSRIPAGFTIALFVCAFFLAIRAMRKEHAGTRRDFLTLLFIWIVVFFILTIPVSFQLRPRFFILVFAVPFILIGLIFDFFQEKFPSKAMYLTVGLFAIVFGANVTGTLAWFGEQKNSQIKDTDIERTLILKNKDGVTRGQLQAVADYMYAQRKGKNTIYYYVKSEHLQPIRYLLNQKNDQTLKFATFSSTPNTDPDAQFFIIIPSHKDLFSMQDEFGIKFEKVSMEDAGQINAYEIFFPNRITSLDFKERASDGSNDRLFWKDVFGVRNNIETQNVIDDSSSDD